MKALWMALALLVSVSAQAETIRFPDEELATESVLPVFDNPESVKSRSVLTSKRFEIGGLGTYNLTEAFFNQYSFGFTGTYHVTEEHGINIFANYFMSGVTSYTNDLNPPPNSTENLNLQFAPRAKWMALANYEYTGFYGKLSWTKSYIMNLSLYGLAGVGGLYVGDKIYPVGSLGLGQKFYFTPQFALRFDLRALIYQGPNILSKKLSSATSEQPSGNFDKRMFIGSLLSIGAIWLIPNS